MSNLDRFPSAAMYHEIYTYDPQKKEVTRSIVIVILILLFVTFLVVLRGNFLLINIVTGS